MALVIYDQGYRIETPVRALFKPGGVDILEPIKGTHHTAGEEQRVHAEGELYRFGDVGQHGHRGSPPRQPPVRGYAPAEDRNRQHRDAPHISAQQIMSIPVYSIASTTNVADAREQLQKRHIDHLVVAGQLGRPLGILSGADLDRSGRHPLHSVADLYSRLLIAASPETEASQLAATFVEYGVGAIPIVDQDDSLVGIVTRTDLLRLLITGAHIEGWA